MRPFHFLLLFTALTCGAALSFSAQSTAAESASPLAGSASPSTDSSTGAVSAGPKDSAGAAIAVPSLDEQLKDLETRAARENVYPKPNPEFHQEVLSLIESGRLASGSDFFRTALLWTTPFCDFRVYRTQYELLLAATAKGEAKAYDHLPRAWDWLQHALGRPLRFDLDAMQHDPMACWEVDAVPSCLREIYLHPQESREAMAGKADNAELKALLEADQAVRKQMPATNEAILAMMKADRERAGRTRELVIDGKVQTKADYYAAALILQHSDDFAGYRLAHELAVCSLLLGGEGGTPWLITATYDRMLLSVGHDQRFGTQGLTLGGATRLRPVDTSGISETERLALGGKTLAERQAHFLEKKKSKAP